mgnify:CR=1 FL=1
MQTHTQHFQSDFDIDRETLKQAAKSPNPEDKKQLWLCRPAGTWCLRERDTFLVFGLCNRPLDGFVFFRGDLYGFFVLCKLRPQGRLFLFAGQFFDMRLYVAAFEMLPAVLITRSAFTPSRQGTRYLPMRWS